MKAVVLQLGKADLFKWGFLECSSSWKTDKVTKSVTSVAVKESFAVSVWNHTWNTRWRSQMTDAHTGNPSAPSKCRGVGGRRRLDFHFLIFHCSSFILFSRRQENCLCVVAVQTPFPLSVGLVALERARQCLSPLSLVPVHSDISRCLWKTSSYLVCRTQAGRWWLTEVGINSEENGFSFCILQRNLCTNREGC